MTEPGKDLVLKHQLKYTPQKLNDLDTVAFIN